MNIWELQNSPNILDRQSFVKRVKFEFIPKVEKRIRELEATMPLEALKLPQVESLPQELSEYTFDYEIEQEKRFLKGLKIMLSNYDIYNQKIVRRCPTCKEIACICYDAGLVEPEQKEFENKIANLFE